MPHDHLSAYLNDHLAGAVAAIELLEHLEHAHGGTVTARSLSQLRTEIEADRDTLESFMKRLQVRESRPRKATAWLAERLAWLKLQLDDSGHGALRLFESLEAVSLGIEGKLGLWRALAAIAPWMPDVSGLDYETLIRRATEQRGRVEALRLGAALPALAATQPTAR
jgi:hypothetical protein